ncbi:hypothetical protein IGB42_02972 [Andreprevotia sp. IGB-42]|uniref:hypothetical protein n=1 Tax=Andreprevotia sp. IGB-42 TaxID=2497473 RepID=UPI0013594297|nr:hypothetical protein [Andreprevotia sp. IGB-42]KAF0812680.1 hypothetical protein IGB42_02972 [Andreprevotia sp. IGB-42]
MNTQSVLDILARSCADLAECNAELARRERATVIAHPAISGDLRQLREVEARTGLIFRRRNGQWHLLDD